MPGRTPHDAYKAFAIPLANALSCVGHGQVRPSRGGKETLDRVHHLFIACGPGERDYLRLQAQGNAPKLELNARMRYEIIKDKRDGYGPYRVTTRWYAYSVQRQDGTAIVDWHWHPDGQSDEIRPHLHLGSAQLHPDSVLSNRMHMLTGRVTFESVIRNLISELRVKPLKKDWEEVLDRCEGPHLQHRSWG